MMEYWNNGLITKNFEVAATLAIQIQVTIQHSIRTKSVRNVNDFNTRILSGYPELTNKADGSG